jgi:hypothetical protein
MSETNSIAQAGPIEIIAEWDGPVILAPGVLFDEAQAENLSIDGDMTALVGWISLTAMSGPIGDALHEASQKKVLGVLSSLRRRFGQPKIDEIKQQLFDHMQQYRNHRKITDEELTERIELLFDEIQV